MNQAMVELAHGNEPIPGEDWAERWLSRIRGLRKQGIGVPTDEAVREGIRTRKAYGGGITRTAFAILCELMEAEQPGEAPARDRLTIEHIIPQKLTDEWKSCLGEDAESVHGQYVDRLANLTLSGDDTNSRLGVDIFAVKREVYRRSAISMTRRLAEIDEWNEDALLQRADDLADRILAHWPWFDDQNGTHWGFAFRWRIEGSPWKNENTGSQMVLNLIGVLLTQDRTNTDRLQGHALGANIHPITRFPPGTKSRPGLRAVPGHDHWVCFPHERNSPAYVERCRKLGERCRVQVEVEILSDKAEAMAAFWRFFKKKTDDDLPGQSDNWRRSTQWISLDNAHGDAIGIAIGDSKLLGIRIRAGNNQVANTIRMRSVSLMMRNDMADQNLSDDLEAESEKGKSIQVERPWTRDNKDEWGEICDWIQDQCARLRLILADVEHLDKARSNVA